MLIWHTKSRIYLRVLSSKPPDPSLAKTPCCKSIPCYITYYIAYYIACVLTSTASLTEMPSLLPVPALGDHSAESPIHPRRSPANPSWAQLEQGQCHCWRGGSQAHLGPFHSLPSPCDPLGPLAVAVERGLGAAAQLELQRHTKSQISFWNVQKTFYSESNLFNMLYFKLYNM